MKQDREFKSSLNNEMEGFLALRESQGHNARKERHIFLTLDRYLLEIGFDGRGLPPDVIDGWLNSLPKDLNRNSRNLYISHYSQFAKYLLSEGKSAFIPETSVADKTYAPRIFLKDELIAMIESADSRLASAAPARKHSTACFSVVLRMLVGCGFRINEVLPLKTGDVDLEQGTVLVRNAKGDKDRMVPMHSSLAETLRIYAHSGIPQADGYFFPSESGKAFSYSWARDHFNKCLESIGIEKPSLPSHARNICPHCLRHSYAVAALRKLDHDGKDMYSEAPILSTYMGHKNIYGTEKYLHMTVENSSDILQKMEDFNNGLFPEVES